jgi:hypothetical protein
VEDLGEPTQLCEMCESIEIRYVHHMEHLEYSESLSVGCVCAEHLEQNYIQPREREKRLKNSARRRKPWVDRVWKVSAKGNDYINVGGFNITVFRQEGGWRLTINNRETEKSQIGRKTYTTQDAAKAAGFGALICAKESL